MRKTGVATLLAAAAFAAPALAETHEIVMLGTGYFPPVTYPAVGDTLVFVNRDDLPMAATAIDDSWTTGPVTPDTQAELEVTEGMTMDFDNHVLAEETAEETTDAAEETTDAAEETTETVTDATGTTDAAEETVTPIATATGRIDYVNPAPTSPELAVASSGEDGTGDISMQE